MDWSLRYTSHLGYRPPERRLQFLATLGTDDPVAHIEYAAKIGMSGVLYAWARDRSETEVSTVRSALRANGLACSCIVALPASLVLAPLWTDRSPAARDVLTREIGQSAELAASLGSDLLAVVVSGDPSRGFETQRDDFIANLHETAAIAKAHGVKLGLEPMKSRPESFLDSIQKTLEILDAVADPQVRLIYDTSHVRVMEGELLDALDRSYRHISLLQFADFPGRVEPGAGELDIASVALSALRRGYDGLVDFEHEWLSPSAEGEAAGLDRLRAFERQVASARASETA